MKQTTLLATAVAALLVSGAALAQATAPKASHQPRHLQLDANKDGAIDRAEAAKAPWVAARFDQLDADKDGKLTAGEFPRRHGKGGPRGGLMAADTDRDGRISRAEFDAAQTRMAGRFDMLDANKDGYIDRADMVLRMQRQRAAFFAAADADKDGKLSRDEFVVERVARFGKGGQRHEGKAGARVPDEARLIERAGAAFDRMDANKDGVLTKAEYEAVPPMGGKGPRQPRR